MLTLNPEKEASASLKASLEFFDVLFPNESILICINLIVLGLSLFII